MVEFIWDSYATLNKCRESMEKQLTGAYLRFGDGDVYLREGRDDMLQKNNPKIAEENEKPFHYLEKELLSAYHYIQINLDLCQK